MFSDKEKEKLKEKLIFCSKCGGKVQLIFYANNSKILTKKCHYCGYEETIEQKIFKR